MRDILFHTQWCAALAMVAVQWPVFVCEFGTFYCHTRLCLFQISDPLLAQTAWATLSYSTWTTDPKHLHC